MVRYLRVIIHVLLLVSPASLFAAGATYTETPYKEQKVLIDFYFNEPEDINSALYWVRTYMNTLMDEPYNIAPEEMDLVIVIRGVEIVTLVKKNYQKYKAAVDRMEYLSLLGVKFKVCGLATKTYGYSLEDFQDFIEVVPSAINELVHWQQQGYVLIKPTILSKKYSVEEIR